MHMFICMYIMPYCPGPAEYISIYGERCMYVCIYIYIHIYLYIYIYICTHTSTYTTCMYIGIYTCTRKAKVKERNVLFFKRTYH